MLRFESSSRSKNAFVSSLKLEFNSVNHTVIKPLDRRKDGIIYKRVKDCAYAVATQVPIDRIIGITAKAKAQHIASCVGTLSHCVCRFNAVYRVGGDTLNGVWLRTLSALTVPLAHSRVVGWCDGSPREQ